MSKNHVPPAKGSGAHATGKSNHPKAASREVGSDAHPRLKATSKQRAALIADHSKTADTLGAGSFPDYSTGNSSPDAGSVPPEVASDISKG